MCRKFLVLPLCQELQMLKFVTNYRNVVFAKGEGKSMEILLFKAFVLFVLFVRS